MLAERMRRGYCLTKHRGELRCCQNLSLILLIGYYFCHAYFHAEKGTHMPLNHVGFESRLQNHGGGGAQALGRASRL
jgi:hypothetical protein